MLHPLKKREGPPEKRKLKVLKKKPVPHNGGKMGGREVLPTTRGEKKRIKKLCGLLEKDRRKKGNSLRQLHYRISGEKEGEGDTITDGLTISSLAGGKKVLCLFAQIGGRREGKGKLQNLLRSHREERGEGSDAICLIISLKERERISIAVRT